MWVCARACTYAHPCFGVAVAVIKVACRVFPLDCLHRLLVSRYTSSPLPPSSQVMMMKDHPHENIVQFFDSFLVEDELWVVMEYLDGGALTTTLQKAQ